MNIFKLLVVVAVAAGAAYYWRDQHRGGPGSSGEVSASARSSRGFVAMPPVTGQDKGSILVIAAENCPLEDAQRADRLAEDLSRSGLPVARLHTASFTLDGPDASSAAEKITAIMNGGLPIVFVHGRAKSNPTLDEVVAEFKAP